MRYSKIPTCVMCLDTHKNKDWSFIQGVNVKAKDGTFA